MTPQQSVAMAAAIANGAAVCAWALKDGRRGFGAAAQGAKGAAIGGAAGLLVGAGLARRKVRAAGG